MAGSAPGAGGRRRVSRSVAAVIALFVGLGGLGTAAGMALGAVGAASSTHDGGGRHHDHGRDLDGPGPGSAPLR